MSKLTSPQARRHQTRGYIYNMRPIGQTSVAWLCTMPQIQILALVAKEMLQKPAGSLSPAMAPNGKSCLQALLPTAAQILGGREPFPSLEVPATGPTKKTINTSH